MKKQFLIIILITSIFLISCASKEPAPPRERDETYIADINPFKVGEFHLYASFGLGKPKISDFTATFYPQTNYIYINSKIGIDKVEFCFSYSERVKLSQAKDKYLELYETNQLPTGKPKKKNAISSGNVYLNWGALGPAHQSYVSYYTNVEYILEGKPYFRILFEQAKENDGSGNSSPRVNVYISPAQWEQILEACNQDRLVQMTDEILAQAEAF